MIEISSGGFGAFADETPTIEVGNNYVFETETGSHHVAIAHIHKTDRGNFIGIRRLSDIYDESVLQQTKPANPAKKFRNYYGNDRSAIVGLMVLTLVVAGIFIWSFDGQSPTLADSTDQQESQEKNAIPKRRKVKQVKKRQPLQQASSSQNAMTSFGEDSVLNFADDSKTVPKKPARKTP